MIGRQTFHQQIAQNKRRSWLLLLVIGAILVLLGVVVGYAWTGEPSSALLFVPAAIGLTGALSAAAWFGGDGLVLAASQARPVSADDAPQLVNVVRELSLAAGIPEPRVYIIDDTAPNAFATGRDPQHASVAITTGLLEKLDREELQGVIAHELSHVRNYDIRFTLLVGVMVGSCPRNAVRISLIFASTVVSAARKIGASKALPPMKPTGSSADSDRHGWLPRRCRIPSTLSTLASTCVSARPSDDTPMRARRSCSARRSTCRSAR